MTRRAFGRMCLITVGVTGLAVVAGWVFQLLAR